MARRYVGWVLRFLGPLSLIVRAGRFTSSIDGVIPVLHDVIPGRDAGQITRRVTDRLNLIGVATVLVRLAIASAKRHVGPERLGMARDPAACDASYPWIPR
ncbi:MAG TPA: hypothetical protein VKP69_30465 [Isosphaeraceae bacterium]|nr:hypothetical protein [Isosphaeraceae bacterium]